MDTSLSNAVELIEKIFLATNVKQIHKRETENESSYIH